MTTFLAAWGAILATAALTWNVVQDIGGRANLQVSAFIGKMYPDHADKDYLVITMVNVGRRPITLQSWGGMKKKDIPKRGIFVPARGLPRMLKESESHNEYIDDLSILDDDLETLHVIDSAGRRWKVSKKNLRRMVEEAKLM